MAEISKLSGVAIADVAKVDAILKASIANINDLTIPSAAAFLLDTYTGAATAYSTRRLNSAYTASAMRVRRDSDDTEQDIGFDSNGDLDTSALATFVGSGNIGHVVTWYDQSSNSNDASMSTVSLQPQIYDGTAVITENGKAAIGFSSHRLTIDAGSMNANLLSAFLVSTSDTTSGTRVALALTKDRTTNRFVLNYMSGGDFYFLYDEDVTAATTANTNQNLSAMLASSGIGGAKGYINGTEEYSYSTLVDATLAGFGRIGAFGSSNFWDGTIQEIVIWSADQSSNRSGIESNINAHYQIGNFPNPTSGLLATYTGAAAAYSVRQLANTAALAMRIREDGTDTETDIGFDSNGDLDTAAISSHCGSNTGYVVTWYDQSGNGRNATQSTSGRQPKIYNGSAVIIDNGKPAIEFSADEMSNSYARTVTAQTTYFVGSTSTSGGQTRIVTNTTRFDYLRYVPLYAKDNTTVASYTDSGTRSEVTIALNTQYLLNFEHTGSTLTNYANGTAGSSYSDSSFSFSIQGDSLGNEADSLWFSGKAQELIIYDSNQSSNRSGIETNINNYFSIY